MINLFKCVNQKIMNIYISYRTNYLFRSRNTNFYFYNKIDDLGEIVPLFCSSFSIQNFKEKEIAYKKLQRLRNADSQLS